MAPRATSLGPRSSLFVFASLVFFCLGGFKGQVRWPKRATSLGTKPSLFVILFVFFSPFFSFNRKTIFSPRKGHFSFIFECLPLFLLSLFWPPPFSIFLSLSLSSSFLSFFLPVFLFCFLFCFLLLPCFCLFLSFSSSLLLFHEKNNIKI